MSEKMNTPPDPSAPEIQLNKKGKLALAGTVVVAAALVAPQIASAVESAQRILNPETSTTGKAPLQNIEQREMITLIENARESDVKLPQIGDTITIKAGTSLYDEGLKQIPLDLLEQNRGNIQGAILESARTANDELPETPYITRKGQEYSLREVDLNGDKRPEYIISLEKNTNEIDGTIPAPNTH